MERIKDVLLKFKHYPNIEEVHARMQELQIPAIAAGGTGEIYVFEAGKTKGIIKKIICNPESSLLCRAKNASEYVAESTRKMQICKKLNEQGVPAIGPSNIYYCKEEDALYEQQPFAYGKIVGISSIETGMRKFLGTTPRVTTRTDLYNLRLTPEEQRVVANGITTYNLIMLNRMLNGRDEHLVKFMSDYKTIVKNDVFIDNNPESFFYDDKKGFSFIDLGEERYPRDVETVTDERIYSEIKSIFSINARTKDILNPTQVDMLETKTAELYERMDSLVQSAGFNLLQPSEIHIAENIPEQ